MQPRYSGAEGQPVIYQVAHTSWQEPVPPCEESYHRQHQHESRMCAGVADGEACKQCFAGDKQTRGHQSVVAGHVKGVAKALQRSNSVLVQ